MKVNCDWGDIFIVLNMSISPSKCQVYPACLAWYVLDALGAGSHARGTNNISEEALAAHPLMKLAMENVVPLLEEAKFGLVALAEKSEVRREGEATLLEYEFYDDDVFRNAGAAVEALDRLGQSQRLIEAASKGSWEGSGLDRHMWIEYHYSYYIVTFVSLADIALVLTNSACPLPRPPCSTG